MPYELPPDQRVRNNRLAAALHEDGRPMYVIAAAARINSSSIGGLVSGRVRPTRGVRARVAAALARSEHELFDVEVDGAKAKASS